MAGPLPVWGGGGCFSSGLVVGTKLEDQSGRLENSAAQRQKGVLVKVGSERLFQGRKFSKQLGLFIRHEVPSAWYRERCRGRLRGCVLSMTNGSVQANHSKHSHGGRSLRLRRWSQPALRQSCKGGRNGASRKGRAAPTPGLADRP
jgi:hypothetical protein